LDNSYQNLNTDLPRYPNRGGGLGIWTSLDKNYSDSESSKGVSVSKQFGYQDPSLRFMPCTSKIIRNLLAQKLFIERWWNWNLGSILSTFYEQLFSAQILKVKKRLTTWLSFLRFWNLHAQKLFIECRWNENLMIFNIVVIEVVELEIKAGRSQTSHHRDGVAHGLLVYEAEERVAS